MRIVNTYICLQYSQSGAQPYSGNPLIKIYECRKPTGSLYSPMETIYVKEGKFGSELMQISETEFQKYMNNFK